MKKHSRSSINSINSIKDMLILSQGTCMSTPKAIQNIKLKIHPLRLKGPLTHCILVEASAVIYVGRF